jgi:hypothetical protein
VYVVASLGGGTGSGMFLDLAYAARAVLREHGYSRAEVIGLFLVPPAADGGAATVAQANAFAALVELQHYAAGAPFRARYEATLAPAEHDGPPFHRAVLLPAGAGPDGDAAAAVGDYLRRELLTPLGSAADRARAADPTATELPAAVRFQVVGLHSLSSPGKRLFWHGVRRLGRDLLDRWTRRGGPETGLQIREEIQQQLHAEELEPPRILAALQAECARKLGKTLEETLAGWRGAVEQTSAEWPGDKARLRRLLEQMDRVLGTPEEEGLQSVPVPAATQEAAARTGDRFRRLLGDLIARYLDRPGRRVAGAHEAIQQATFLVERALQLQEAEARKLTAQALQIWNGLRSALKEPENGLDFGKRNGRAAPNLAEVARVLAEYPRVRSLAVAQQRLAGLYLSLRGFLSDQVRELRLDQQPLELLRRSLEQVGEEDDDGPAVPVGDVGTPDEVVERTVHTLTPDDWQDFDQAIQDAAQANQHGLTSVSAAFASSPGLRSLRAVIVQEAEKLLAERLPALNDAAGLLLARCPDEAALAGELREAFAAAAPLAVPGGTPLGREVALLVAGPVEGRFARTVRATLPEVEVVPTGKREELVFYREWTDFSVEALQDLGLLCAPAYSLACATDATPHTRMDVAWGGVVRAGAAG